MNLILIRDTSTPTCTLGLLHVGGHVFHTLERPWVPDPASKCGRKGVSCVAPGVYRLVKHNTEAHPKVWALVNPALGVYHQPTDVPAGCEHITRTAVLIHPANYPHEIRGCIAPGMSRGPNAVWNSRQAMKKLRELVPWTNDHTLEIRYAEGVSP